MTSADTQGTSRSLTITRTNKTVEQLLAKIEVRLERLKEGDRCQLLQGNRVR